MSEKPKRLAPKTDVLRELYLKSGNRCTFPGCGHLVMDAEGNFVAQICHIEAAEEGGERFNPKQSNEDRRSFGNLVLLCYPHHVITNNVVEFPVTKMQEMKRTHEAKFSDIASKIRSSIQDHTDESQLCIPSSLGRMNEVLGWKLSSEELKEIIPIINQFADKVKLLPIPARELLAVAIKRGKVFGRDRRHMEVPLSELLHACDLTEEKLKGIVVILQNRSVATVDRNWEDESHEVLCISEVSRDLSCAQTLQEFCEFDNLPIQRLIVDLRFDLLD